MNRANLPSAKTIIISLKLSNIFNFLFYVQDKTYFSKIILATKTLSHKAITKT